MKKITNTLLHEEYYYLTLNNGMHVYLYPKPKFHRTYGVFATKFGSCDLEFYDPQTNELVVTPPGVAHFLEHKMFECSDGSDATDLFSEIGGESNAYTTYDKTAYLFTCTENELENIQILLDFVQSPYFTNENVNKEKGIIEQELKMYLDRASTAIYIQLLNNMYKKNHVRYDIGGTLESINQIDEKILQQCYDVFYHPSNMVLSLIGNFDLDKVIELIKQNQDDKYFNVNNKIKRRYYLEDEKVVEEDTTSYMDITTPKVGCGVKFSVLGLDNKSIYKNMILLDILMDMTFDESSDFYHRLLNKKIINNSFGYDTYFEPTYAHVTFTVDTLKVEEFKNELYNELINIKNKKIDQATFNRYKKIELANAIARFNYLESIANLIVDLDGLDLELFDTIDIKNNIKVEDLNEIMKMFKEESITFHTIYPTKNLSE